MIKFIGASTVVLCTGLMGMSKGRKYALRPRQLRNLQSALQMLETEISYGATPLPEAMEQIALRTGKPENILFNAAREELMSMTGCTVKEAWERSLNLFSRHSVLEESDYIVLRQLGSSLGISDRQDQSKHLHLALEQLKAQEANAADRASTHVKLWNYLGFLAGLSLVTIFY